MTNELLDNETVSEIPLKYIERQNQVNFAIRSIERGMTRGNIRAELEQKGYSSKISERLVEEAIVTLREKRLKNGRNELWGGIVLVLVCLPMVIFVRYLLIGVVAGITSIAKGISDIKRGKATI